MEVGNDLRGGTFGGGEVAVAEGPAGVEQRETAGNQSKPALC